MRCQYYAQFNPSYVGAHKVMSHRYQLKENKASFPLSRESIRDFWLYDNVKWQNTVGNGYLQTSPSFPPPSGEGCL